MREGVKWTNLTRGEISQRLAERGTPVGHGVVKQLLRRHGYVKRKAQKVKAMGTRHPDRNAQFENIARLKREYLVLCHTLIYGSSLLVPFGQSLPR